MTAPLLGGARTAPVIDVVDAFCLRPTPQGAVAALRGLTLTVSAGERVVIHGPNGAGKSTLLRVLSGDEQLSAGRAQVAGVDLTGAAESAAVELRRRFLGVIDQRTMRTLRPELSVIENVALQLRLGGAGRAAAHAKSQLTMAELGVAEFADRRVGSLSAGEAQRVSIAAALAHDPQVILADEPTGELDTASAEAVHELLVRATGERRALIVVSHDELATAIATRVLRIRDGRLSEEWDPTNLNERLVVDDRGWVRLPEKPRRAVGADSRVQLEQRGEQLILRGYGEQGTVDEPSRVDDALAASRSAIAASAPRPGGLPAATTPYGRLAPTPAAPAPPAVTMTNVCLSYGNRQVLDHLSWQLPELRLVALTGRSGAGKSSLVRLLAGLSRPNSGQICVDTIDLGTATRGRLADLRRQYFAVVEHDGALADAIDVDANLALARTVRRLPADSEVCEQVLEWLDLVSLRSRLTNQLSGGERQRVAVARALVVTRPFIVLDEPTAHLDEAQSERLADLLAHVAESGTTVLCATHDPVLIAQAHEVRHLEDGRWVG